MESMSLCVVRETVPLARPQSVLWATKRSDQQVPGPGIRNSYTPADGTGFKIRITAVKRRLDRIE
jgi:hypothetical protein